MYVCQLVVVTVRAPEPDVLPPTFRVIRILGSLWPASQPAIAHREPYEHQASSNQLHWSPYGIQMSPYDSNCEPPSCQNLKNSKEYCCFEEVP